MLKSPAISGQWKIGRIGETRRPRENRRSLSDVWTDIGERKRLVDAAVKAEEAPRETHEEIVERTIIGPYYEARDRMMRGPEWAEQEQDRLLQEWLERKRAARGQAKATA